MNTTAQRNTLPEKNDDLDLLLIVKRAVDFFRMNGVRLLIASVVGLFCGLILYFSTPKYFTSRLLLETTVLNNTESRAILDNWNKMLRPSGYPYLMQEFGCSDRVVKNLMKITAESLSQLNETGTALAIDVTVRDTSLLNDLKDALVRGISQIDYVRRRVTQRRQGTQDQIDEVVREIAKLDSSRGIIGSLFGTEKKENTPVIVDIANLSAQRTALTEKLASLRETLAFMQAVSVLQGFTATQGPKPGFITFLAVGLIGGFIIGYLISIARSLKAKISTL